MMKRRMFALCALLSLCIVLVVPAFASISGEPCMVDNAGLLDDYDVAQLQYKLSDVSQRHEMDVVILTTDTLDGKDLVAYSDDYYDYNGYSDDGILLVVPTMEEGAYISTKGFGITAFTDAGIQYIGKQIRPDLDAGNYYTAFERFAELADEFITKAESGEAYDIQNLPKEPLSLWWFVLMIGVGALLALFPLASMKAKLKTVRPKQSAASYVRKDSFHLTTDRDVFLYHTVSRRERPKNDSSSSGGSSTHTSSSGSTHGGGRI